MNDDDNLNTDITYSCDEPLYIQSNLGYSIVANLHLASSDGKYDLEYPSVDDLAKELTELHEEKLLREMHPGLQELWEKYQIMLALVRKSLENE